MRVYLEPEFRGVDQGDGGIRRCVEAQLRHLPSHDIEIVSSYSDADIVHCHVYADASTHRWLEVHTEVPLLISSHGAYWAEYEWPGKWYHKANENLMEAIRQADAVTAPSEWVAQSLRRNTLRRVTVIGHGVNLDEWPVQKENRGFVLWAKNRPDPVCDPDALNQLAKMAPDVQFVSTFGDKSLPNLGITGRLPYDQARQAVQDCVVYLCTTRETFGIGTLEAMACGAPVLGWAWGGQVDIVDHKETGWLARPGDFDGLLEGLRYCLQHREEMGRRARAVVEERYRWEDVIGKYAALYNDLLTERATEGPKVSVVVPAYNLERFLPAALESVLAQTESDWECIVVDDASPDGCGRIAEEYAARDTRFRVVHNQENQYLAGALNAGAAVARGRYILPLDADNLLPQNAIEVLSHALDVDRSIHIAYGNVKFVIEDGQPDHGVGAGGHSGWPMEFAGETQLTRRNRDGRPANLVPSTSMYRREVWELTGGYRRRFRTAEDADFWTRAASYGFRPKMVTQADMLIYRNRNGSMSRQEQILDWTRWLPWSQGTSLPPSAVISGKQAPVPSHDPPQISVIIPVGPQHRELVVDAIDSVDAQTFREWECVVVNDSGEPLRWVPSWARLVETGGGKGVGAARNTGVEACSSPLFVPLDADDMLEPGALARMYDVQREYGGYVYCDFHQVWKDQAASVWEAPEYDARALLRSGCLHAVTGLFRVADWREVKGYDERLAWEDWDFQLKLADIGVCGTRIPEPLFTYRKDTGLRREENYAEFDESKAGILEKWGPYFEGKRTLMGCNRCPGGGGMRLASRVDRSNATPIELAATEQMEVIEYVGARMGTMTYRGPSGTAYRFSGMPSGRQKLVLKADVDYFLAMLDFRLKEDASSTVGQPAGVGGFM